MKKPNIYLENGLYEATKLFLHGMLDKDGLCVLQLNMTVYFSITEP